MITASTLRPGILVALNTSIRGNIKYESIILEGEHRTEDGGARARWETVKRVADKDEHEAAIRVRQECRNLITRVCTASAFGLLCPEDRADALDAALSEARAKAEAFNAAAKLTRVKVYVMCGRIAQDDVEAVRAINAEVRDLMDDMERGLRNLDVEVVRQAATKAKAIGNMLAPDAQARVTIAVEAARTAARQMVKAAEQGAAEIDKAAVQRVRESRAAFVDFDMPEVAVAIPEAEGRAVDLEPAVAAEIDAELDMDMDLADEILDEPVDEILDEPEAKAAAPMLSGRQIDLF